MYLYLGKYYVVDSGYPNRLGYLSTYKGQRYTKVKGTIFLVLEGVKLLWSMEDEVEDFTQDA